LVLDSGAFIALERRDMRIVDAIEAVRQLGVTIVTPAAVLAEVWRQPPHAAIARLVNASHIDDLDEEAAKRTGSRLAHGGTMVDANVVDVAMRYAPARIATSDSTDIRALLPSSADVTLLEL
jgi:hypothetical protein